jgi:hypothetical protein
LEREEMTGPSPDVGFAQRTQFSRQEDFEGATKIGASCEDVRLQLSELTLEMQGLLEGQARELLTDAHRLIGSMVCRVAIIGQVKSGKSSLINALIGQPRFLPSDVNPWTTAVTRLHSTRGRGQENVAAEFQFFDPDEWHKLAVGGSRIRELTERLVPGFEPALLSRNLHAMQKRSAERLGGELSSLLGMTHSFAKLDARTLETYVCAGTASKDPAVGRYSDVTKSANLYLDAAPFSFPTVLIDTPGINDPYLVRDEITRQALDAADIHIVVLTARQALSNDDIALLRILRGLNKERLIVFVNRIDELGDLENEFELVQDQVARGLERERIGSDVSVIYGSSRWALNVLETTGPGSVAQTLARLRSKRGGAANPCVQELLYLCSGTPRLNRALDAAVQSSYPFQVIKHLAGSLVQLSQLNVSVTRDELSLQTSAAQEPQNGSVGPSQSGYWELAKSLEMSFDTFEHALTSTAQKDVARLEASLNQVMRQFSESERRRLKEVARVAVWACDTSQLRLRLETAFTDHFNSIQEAVASAEREFLSRLDHAITGAFGGKQAGYVLHLSPSPMQPPSTTALAKIVALDLGTSWWQAWWSNTPSADSRAEALDRLIAQEFGPIIDALARSALERITAQIGSTMREARAICLGVVETLHCKGGPLAASTPEKKGSSAAQSSNPVPSLAETTARLGRWRAMQARSMRIYSDCAILNKSCRVQR